MAGVTAGDTAAGWSCRPAAVGGVLKPPGDKSVSHRALMLGGIATGDTEIRGFLPGADCLATLSAMRSLGVAIDIGDPARIVVRGAGLHGLEQPEGPLDLGNAGTGMRLLTGLLAAQRFPSVLTGDASLSQRPMQRIAEPLALMGARIATTDGHAPLHIEPVAELRGIDYDIPVASAQVKSALLLAGLYARGTTRVHEPAPSRDHTERMLCEFGVAVKADGAGSVAVDGGAQLAGCTVHVPGDFSAAAFFMVAAAIAPGSRLRIENVGVNPTRTGLLELLRAMGADIRLVNQRVLSGEPVADIDVHGKRLRGIEVPVELVPLAIDEFPVFFVAAACARGTTTVSGAAELRVKESDRIAVMAQGLEQLGVVCETRPDGITIRGGRPGGGVVNSGGDHRIAMAFAIAGSVAEAPIHVRDVANVATSFPDFPAAAAGVGLSVEADD